MRQRHRWRSQRRSRDEKGRIEDYWGRRAAFVSSASDMGSDFGSLDLRNHPLRMESCKKLADDIEGHVFL